MTNYQPIYPAVTGTAPAANAAAASDTYTLQPNTKYLLLVKNGSGASITATPTDVVSQPPAGASAFSPSPVVTIPAGADRMILIDSNRFRDPNTGLCTIAFSSTTTVTHTMWAQQ